MNKYEWQDEEKGLVCQQFAKPFSSWNYTEVIECLAHEKSKNIEIFNMKSNDDTFSFRRVGDKYSFILNGEGEMIKKETFDFFSEVCKDFIRQTEQLG